MNPFAANNIPSPEDKILEYQDQLSFIQSELVADRAKLQQAKNQNWPIEMIREIEQDITNMETAVDQVQQKIKMIQSQIK
jgi:hypothetical protein